MIAVHLIRLVGTIDIAVTDPDIGYAAIAAALELILLADEWRATGLVLTAWTIPDAIATLHTVHTEGGTVAGCLALQMVLEAGELITVELV